MVNKVDASQLASCPCKEMSALKDSCVFFCSQVTRHAAAFGIKYVAFDNYEGTIFGMFHAPHQLLLSKLIRFDDTTPSVLEVLSCCMAMPFTKMQFVKCCVAPKHGVTCLAYCITHMLPPHGRHL